MTTKKEKNVIDELDQIKNESESDSDNEIKRRMKNNKANNFR